jgi:serine/threonine protein kinase
LFQKKVIHKDLKLDNLFLNAKGDIKIGDFGFATTEKEAKKLTSYNIGSP